LVQIEVGELWVSDRLSKLWAENPLPGWPPLIHPPAPTPKCTENVWQTISVRVRREVVGPHSREQCNVDCPLPGEVLAGRFRVQHCVGEGHFTKAFLAEDLTKGGSVCVKRHRSLTVEAVADLMVLAHRMEEADTDGLLFPRLVDAFYDIVGFTVESLIEGRNCLSVAQSKPLFFNDVSNLQHVALGTLKGLAALDRAGVVHNDVKPDNLIWSDIPIRGTVIVKIVDFGCARLDHRAEPAGRNWSLSEGGAGHLGKWSPEMALRLPITHRGDVWGVAVSLCELHCGRFVWRNEGDTAEMVLAQALGLCGLREGLPPSLLRRSPLDVRELYTPAPRHFPIRRNALGQLEALRPIRWGLEQVLGEGWREAGKIDLGELLQSLLTFDPLYRPSASQALERCRFVGAPEPQHQDDDAAKSPSPASLD